jgi:hypothetical protein
MDAAKDGWPRRVKWMYNRYEHLLFRWVKVRDFFLPQPDRRCLRALRGTRAHDARWVEFSWRDWLRYPWAGWASPALMPACLVSLFGW